MMRRLSGPLMAKFGNHRVHMKPVRAAQAPGTLAMPWMPGVMGIDSYCVRGAAACGGAHDEWLFDEALAETFSASNSIAVSSYSPASNKLA